MTERRCGFVALVLAARRIGLNAGWGSRSRGYLVWLAHEHISGSSYSSDISGVARIALDLLTKMTNVRLDKSGIGWLTIPPYVGDNLVQCAHVIRVDRQQV